MEELTLSAPHLSTSIFVLVSVTSWLKKKIDEYVIFRKWACSEELIKDSFLVLMPVKDVG